MFTAGYDYNFDPEGHGQLKLRLVTDYYKICTKFYETKTNIEGDEGKHEVMENQPGGR